jgi:hypothetical protein
MVFGARLGLIAIEKTNKFLAFFKPLSKLFLIFSQTPVAGNANQDRSK